MKLRTLFSGIGAPESALKNLGIEYELVDFCEIDKYAVKSYCAIHGVDESKNLGDISKVWGGDLPYADLLVWGFPCTDISVAGKQAGIIEGETRSGLYYEGLGILRETKPKYSIIENVKNLVGKQFKAEFEQMLKDIELLGYNNYWKVLNAKDFGIPQNRERVFIVSIRKDADIGGFDFPEGFDNGLRLKDFLEDEVDEKFYISNEKVEKIINSTFMQEKKMIQNADGICSTLLARDYKDPKCIPCITPDREEKRQNGRRFKEDGEPMFTLTSQDRHGILQVGMLDIKGNEQVRRVYSEDGLSPTLNTMAGGNRQPKVAVREATKCNQATICLNSKGGRNGIEGLQPSLTDRVYDSEGISTAITTSEFFMPSYTTDYRIRKLTPKECFRLMGFSDEEFQRCVDAGVSNSQLYKQAGNSIVTDVLYYIFKNLLKEVKNVKK
ncbi:MAG: DNA (cytosine-5-)-methyltransferase [Clostridia bacterium]|nr:DNA (cytosine-5-)-methyltransferase [Clostridia bacterium]